MADEALFLGWGEIVRGRETKAVEVFNESVQYYGELQQAGKIDSFDAWFLSPHGGDLAGLIAERTGTLHAYTGEALGRLMGQFEEAGRDLGG